MNQNIRLKGLETTIPTVELWLSQIEVAMAEEEDTVVDMVEEEEAAVVMIDAATKIENETTEIRRPSFYEMVLTSGIMRATTSRQTRCDR